MHTANTLAYFKKNPCLSKNIYYLGDLRKMYFSMDFTKKNHFSHFWILQHVCKIQRVLANIPKNLKTLFWWFILFTVGIWINKSYKG